jgi:hypothetical protein
MKTKWISVAIEEKAWTSEVKSSLLSLAVKTGKPVFDEQKLVLTGKVIWLALTGVLLGFVIGAIIL